MYSSVNGFPEDGLCGLKNVGQSSQNNCYLWLHVQFLLDQILYSPSITEKMNNMKFIIFTLHKTLLELPPHGRWDGQGMGE